MLKCFGSMVNRLLKELSEQYEAFFEDGKFCKQLIGPKASTPKDDIYALNIISCELQRVYKKSVVVLIDEYNAPMNSAIEHNYTTVVSLAYSFILLCCSCLCYFRPMNYFLLYLDHC